MILQLNCTGIESCSFSTIIGVSHIGCHGENCLANSTIYSEIYNGGTLTIEINDDINLDKNGFDLYCSPDDKCIVFCRSSMSCQLMTGHCFGQCLIYCDNIRICPANLTGNITLIDYEPTLIPSHFTSYISSDAHIPSNIPTNEPTITGQVRTTISSSIAPTSSITPSIAPSATPGGSATGSGSRTKTNQNQS